MNAASLRPAAPPPAPRIAWSVTEHGETRHDEYRWLADRQDPRTLPWLKANNQHAHAALADTAALQAQILDELQRLTPPDEGQAAWEVGGHWYRTRYTRDQNYPVFVRHLHRPDGPEQILIDGNALAAAHAFFSMEGIQLSPRCDRLVFATDTVGRRLFTLHFKDLASGQFLADRIEGVEPLSAWGADGRTIFYVRPDPVTLRPHRVYRHTLGTAVACDTLVHEETDPALRIYVSRTRSQKFILIHIYSSDSGEVRYIPSADPERAPAVLMPRERGHDYEVDHAGEHFLIRTNRHAPNFRVCEVAVDAPPDTPWREVVPAHAQRLIEQMAAFQNHLVLIGYQEGRQQAWVVDRRSGNTHAIVFPDPAYHVWIDVNPRIDTRSVRLGYTSLVTPVSYFDYEMDTRCLQRIRSEQVAGYVPAAYETRQIHATAPDGTRVPVTLVGRRDILAAGQAPLFIFAYGAYGTNMPLYFDQSRLVLLQRGFIYAMVHVRGGSELGRQWYEAGRLRNKMNTITDFIAATEHLVAIGLARRDRLFAETLSAGGLLLGTTLNLRPDLFRGVVAREPFVDLLNTMADPSQPLVSCEYGEWGHPHNRDDWEYMRSYSPYDNITPQPYPHVLATAGLYDSQVLYWEPAKWIARLRANNTGNTQQLLLTHLQAGHAGISGRQGRERELALIYTFLLAL